MKKVTLIKPCQFNLIYVFKGVTRLMGEKNVALYFLAPTSCESTQLSQDSSFALSDPQM